MSTKRLLASAYDRLLLTGVAGTIPFESISLTPVFHVEQLHVDKHFNELARFLESYRALTGVRAVITCITPRAPMLEMALQEVGFDAETYWDRIGQLGAMGLVGLHGHYARAFVGEQVNPMHWSFHDISVIQRQLAEELAALRARRLVNDELLVYSGGWWFTSSQLRAMLVRAGFKWDYTVSSSKFNVSPGSSSLPVTLVNGVLQQTLEGDVLKSALAVSSIAGIGRPYHSISKIVDATRGLAAEAVTFSLYSHDYDLDTDNALLMVRRFLDAGFSFVEPYQ